MQFSPTPCLGKYRIACERLRAGLALTFAVLCAVVGGACAGETGDGRVLVFAAASLTDAVTELEREYEAMNDVEVDVSFAGSVSLARQIIAGAPADVFVAAGAAPIDLLIDEGLVHAGGGRPVLGNELVLVSTGDSPGIDSLDDLASGWITRLAVVDPGLGPAGVYSREALRAAGLWETLLPIIALVKDVRTALAYLASGNVDVVMVYRTDAATVPEMKVEMAVPSELHSPIMYLGAALASSADDPNSVAFLDYLLSDRAGEIFRKHGFTDPPAIRPAG